jgi:thiopurine S-methyltransferase
MDASFWHERWRTNEIPFHERAVNPLLLKHFPALALAKGSRVFVPLCGKSLDIGWLLSCGHDVVGAELSEIAVRQLFAELGMEPSIAELGNVRHYSGKQIDIFAGDIFDVSREMLGPVDAVYDRAALVALPEDMRPRYVAHLKEITADAPQLLICYEYDQALMAGPPFSVGGGEVHRLYGGSYRLTLLESADVAGGLKGKCPARENVWLLKRRC